MPPESGTFTENLTAALAENDIRRARTIVSEAEALLFSNDANAAEVTRTDIAAAKARIALATGDGPAAHAILVAAIEAAPTHRALRVLMTEAMLAMGRATDVRPVLQHIGKRPKDDAKETQNAGS
ncbi:tetratricopeptide repeat protein [Gymnodinialimonas sp. 2307UL20-7]